MRPALNWFSSLLALILCRADSAAGYNVGPQSYELCYKQRIKGISCMSY